VTTANGQARSDQFWPGAAYTPNGALVVSYYDRQYGSDNNTGFSDITVSQSWNATTFRHDRATSSSMPPPTQFNGTFYGPLRETPPNEHSCTLGTYSRPSIYHGTRPW
jgi:hypothetical protein